MEQETRLTLQEHDDDDDDDDFFPRICTVHLGIINVSFILFLCFADRASQYNLSN